MLVLKGLFGGSFKMISLCVLSPALNLSKNSCVFPFFDQGIGRRKVQKLMSKGARKVLDGD